MNNNLWLYILILYISCSCTLMDGKKVDKFEGYQGKSDSLLDWNNFDEVKFEFAYRAQNDPYKPMFHFSPEVFWLNDPNGLFQYNGIYHLFYQYSNRIDGPNEVKYWGHATSCDLTNWDNHPVALSPDTNISYISKGIWSGSATMVNGIPTLFFTGVLPEVQCMATPSDMTFNSWEMNTKNPILASHNTGLPLIAFRDPYVWKEGSNWMMIVGSGTWNNGGMIPLYASNDLEEWNYIGPLFQDIEKKYSYLFECPSLNQTGDKYIFTYSGHKNNGRLGSFYFIGKYQDGKFIPEVYGALDISSQYYAAQLFKDEHGRLLAFAWIKDNRKQECWKQSGWSGVISFAREITINDKGHLEIRPVKELRKLRKNHTNYVINQVDGFTSLKEFSSNRAEIGVEFVPNQDGLFSVDRIGLSVLESSDRNEKTLIYFEPKTKMFTINTISSGVYGKYAKDTLSASESDYFQLAPFENLKIRVIVDNSIIEVFVNDRIAGTVQVFPDQHSINASLYTHGGSANVKKVESWVYSSNTN